MRSTRLVPLVLLLALPVGAAGQRLGDVPDVVLAGTPFQITIEGGPDGTLPYEVRAGTGALLATGSVDAGASVVQGGLVVSARADLPLTVSIGGTVVEEVAPTLTPGWFSLVPPLVAILLALVFREVVSALFVGVWVGALAVAGFNPVAGTWRLIDRFVIPELANTADGHTHIVVFSLLLGGMVGIMSRSGGTMGIVEAVRPFARSARRGQLATWLAGMGVFFDDYANTLIVGNTMRPITDRLRISREKLAYLVDCTAAPLAAIVPISTWVGYEISLIRDGLAIAAEQNPDMSASLDLNALTVFVETIPYRFYPVLALYFAALVALTRRDFGPMAAAERRARHQGEVHRPGAQLLQDTSSEGIQAKHGVHHRWWNAALPVATVVGVVLAGLYVTGRAGAGPDAGLWDVFGASDPFTTMAWGSLAGCLVAIALSVGQRLLTVQESVEAWVNGMRSMIIAIVILTLAWSLGSVTADIGTAAYLSQLLTDRVALHLIPVLVFATAAAMSFATGTSWGTMGILLPLAIPLTAALGGSVDDGGTYTILLGSISSVLAGAIFGDHCSPISDTTVLSSAASGCDHVDHVRTQLPYALLVAIVGMLLGDIGTAYGLPVWAALLGGMVVLYGFLRIRGELVEDVEPDPLATRRAAGDEAAAEAKADPDLA